jgi:hypothetical protein
MTIQHEDDLPTEILVSDEGEGTIVEGRKKVKKQIFSVYMATTAVQKIERVCALTGASKNAWIQLAIAEKLIRDGQTHPTNEGEV